MSINSFFLIIFVSLMIIFVGFKPLDVKQQEFIDVPLFQLESFTLHELDQNGLLTLMEGSKAIRFKDRYKVADINFTDNSNKFVANMVANNGLYMDASRVLNLDGDIKYAREDNLTFHSQVATYSRDTSVAIVDGKYTLYRDLNRVKGTYLNFNSIKQKIYSKNIVAVFQIKGKDI